MSQMNANESWLRAHLATTRKELMDFEKQHSIIVGKYEAYEAELTSETKSQADHQKRLADWRVKLDGLNVLIVSRNQDIPNLEVAIRESIVLQTQAQVQLQQTQLPHAIPVAHTTSDSFEGIVSVPPYPVAVPVREHPPNGRSFTL